MANKSLAQAIWEKMVGSGSAVPDDVTSTAETDDEAQKKAEAIAQAAKDVASRKKSKDENWSALDENK